MLHDEYGYTNHLIYVAILCYVNLPVFGHNKHCPGEANETADSAKQHSVKDMDWSLTASPSQPVWLKQTGAVKYICIM